MLEIQLEHDFIAADYAAQDYFESNTNILFPDTENYIATTCLRYLSFDALGNGYYLDKWDLPSRLYRRPHFQHTGTITQRRPAKEQFC